MHVGSVLEKFGYKKNEIRIYLACLELSESLVADIAKHTALPRTTVLELLEEMRKKGLVDHYFKKKRKYWVARDPEKLLLDQKEKEEELAAIIPELKNFRKGELRVPEVKLYTGIKEIKLVMDDIIESKRHILAAVNWEEWIKFFGWDYVEDFIERRCAHFLRIRLITSRTESSLSLKSRDEKQLRATRFLPQGVELHNSNFIYGDKVAIFSMSRREPVGILIEDEEVGRTMSVFFESLWGRCQEK